MTDWEILLEELIAGGRAAANKITQHVEPWDRRFEAATTRVVVATSRLGHGLAEYHSTRVMKTPEILCYEEDDTS
jgi:hypothetical protein